MPQRGRCDAGNERVVDMNDVELDAFEQAFERAADVERQGRGSRARTTGSRDAASECDHGGTSVSRAISGPIFENGLGTLMGRGDRFARLAYGLA